jgi:hypothetical protein
MIAQIVLRCHPAFFGRRDGPPLFSLVLNLNFDVDSKIKLDIEHSWFGKLVPHVMGFSSSDIK